MDDEAHRTSVPGLPSMRMAEIKVPYRRAGRTISELDVRRKFGVTILLVRRKTNGHDKLVEAVPTADTTLQTDDLLLVMGTDDDIRRFEVG
jgi:trk system potassium uptake protein TrkA